MAAADDTELAHQMEKHMVLNEFGWQESALNNDVSSFSQFQDGTFAKDKERMLSEFKEMYKSRGPLDLEGQGRYLAALGDLYFEKARAEPDEWTHYVKAHALYNSAALRDNSQSLSCVSKSYQVEELYFGGRHPLSESNRKLMTSGHKQKLGTIREQMKRKVEHMTQLTEGINVNDIACDDNRHFQRIFTEFAMETCFNCTDQMKELASEIISASIELAGVPPCPFETLALGSLARREATPYSDLEYLFLIKDSSDVMYFEKLAITSYFLITNLQETKLRYMNIAELRDWFDDKAANGFKIDGLGLYAGNIPTGNGLSENKNKFIKTPAELFSDYKLQWNKTELDNEDGIADLCDMLASSTVIHSYRSTDHQLSKTFEMNRCSLSQTYTRLQTATKMIKTDIDKYSFVPYTEINDNKQLEVKYDVYRYPTILLYDLKVLFNLATTTVWDTLHALSNNHGLSDSMKSAMEFLVGVACFARLATYLKHEGQHESVSVLLEEKRSYDCSVIDRTLYYFPRSLFHLMATYMIPVKAEFYVHDPEKAIKQTIACDTITAKSITHFYCLEWKECLSVYRDHFGETFLKNPRQIEFFLQLQGYPKKAVCDIRNNMLTKALYEAGEYDLALEYHKEMLKMESSTQARDATVSDSNIATFHNNIGLLYKKKGEFDLAIKHFKKSLEMTPIAHSNAGEHADIATCHSNIGGAYRSKGTYELALEHYKKSLEIRLASYGRESNHPYIASSHNGLGGIYESLGKHSLALEHYKKSLAMAHSFYGVQAVHPDIATSHNNIAGIYDKTGKYNLALEHSQKSLEIFFAIYGPQAVHHNIASRLNNIGSVHESMGKYDSALEHYKKALDMRLLLYGTDAAHPEVAESHNNIGSVCDCMGEYESALEHYTKSLEINHSIYGPHAIHPDIATNHNNIGGVYELLGKYDLALEHHEKSLKMKLAIYKDQSVHPDIAMSHNNIGLVYDSMGEYDLALEYYKKSLNMRLLINGSQTVHPDIATAYNNLGRVYDHLGKYDLSLEHHKKSMEIFQSIFGGQAHRNVALSHTNIGSVFFNLSKYDLALEHFLKALDIFQTVYGPNSNHPDIQATQTNIRTIMEIGV